MTCLITLDWGRSNGDCPNVGNTLKPNRFEMNVGIFQNMKAKGFFTQHLLSISNNSSPNKSFGRWLKYTFVNKTSNSKTIQ